MLSRDMTSTAAGALRTAAAAVIVAVAVTACGVSGPDPVACKGLPTAEVERLAQQVRDGG